MISCPYCGTHFQTFQPNCKNCGGPLPEIVPDPFQAVEDLLAPPPLVPPPPPRSISNAYTWKLLMIDGWSIGAFILVLTGGIMLVTGIGLIFGIVTAIVGIPLAFIGGAMFVGGLALGIWRYQEIQKIVNVLRFGESAPGQITNVQENTTVAINDRHPWTIEYDFVVGDRLFSGKVTTLTPPGLHLQTGRNVYVLYLPSNPALSSLFPHP